MIGVYFLYLKKQLMYIGQSRDIDKRVRQHRFEFDMVSIIHCEETELRQLERDMIKTYNPSINRMRYKHPIGTFRRRNGMICIDVDLHFYEHLKKMANRRGMKLGKYIKAILRKQTGYKEKELV